MYMANESIFGHRQLPLNDRKPPLAVIVLYVPTSTKPMKSISLRTDWDVNFCKLLLYFILLKTGGKTNSGVTREAVHLSTITATMWNSQFDIGILTWAFSISIFGPELLLL